MASLTFTMSVSGASVTGTTSAVNSVTGTGVVIIDGETVAGSTTDAEINLDLDVTAMVGLWFYSDETVTIEWNDSAGSQGSFTLTGGIPKVYFTNGPTNPFGADVTSIFVTNAGSDTATLTLIALQDATPA